MGASASSIQLASSSSHVKIPVAVVNRANQARLTFLAAVDPVAKEQAVTLTATLDGTSVQDTILVTPSPAPVLTVAEKQFARFGTRLSFTITGQDPLAPPLTSGARRHRGL